MLCAHVVVGCPALLWRCYVWLCGLPTALSFSQCPHRALTPRPDSPERRCETRFRLPHTATSTALYENEHSKTAKRRRRQEEGPLCHTKAENQSMGTDEGG